MAGNSSPYSGEKLEEHELAHLMRFRLNTFAGQVMLLIAFTWFVQKDLITMAIKNYMIARQQTQL